MPRKLVPGPKSALIKRKQKNGDVYVFNRTYHYDPETKKVVTDKEVLEYKIVNGEKTQTRYKKPSQKTEPDEGTGKVKASRKRVGAMELLEHIGEKTGIDRDLLDVTDEGRALKTLSIARYWVATGGHTLPLIEEWQLLHKLPYEDGITETICQDLFHDIGMDFEMVRNYFKKRIEWCDTGLVVALGSTTVSTCSKNQDNADYGFEKEKTGLPAIKVIWLYSISSGQPIAYSRIAGNIADVSTVINSIIQLQALGVKVAEVIMDNGYPSDENAAAFFAGNLDFIVKVHTGYAWVRNEIDRNYRKFGKATSYCDEEMRTSGICVGVEREYTHEYKEDDPVSGHRKGEVVKLKKKSKLLLYRNDDMKNDEDAAFRTGLGEIRDKIRKKGMQALTEQEKRKASKYLHVPNDPSGYDSIRFNNSAIARACRYNGIIALHASKEDDPASALSKYRKREKIEESIQCCKDECDGKRPRGHSDTVFNGRLFAQMVAMGYREGFQKELDRVSSKVGSIVAEGKWPGISANEMKVYGKLKTWLHKKSVEQILYALDIKEESIVSGKMRQRAMRSEYTAMQRLFVDLFMEKKEG